jgi:hypothetical protein
MRENNKFFHICDLSISAEALIPFSIAKDTGSLNIKSTNKQKTLEQFS